MNCRPVKRGFLVVSLSVIVITRRFPRDEIVGLVFDKGGPPDGENTRHPHLVITQLGEKGPRFHRLISGIREDQAKWIIEAGQLTMGDWRDGHAGRLLPGRGESLPADPTSNS